MRTWYEQLPQEPYNWWPILNVKLKSRTGFQTALALVDSGASNSILHPIIAKGLGFDLEKLGKPQIQGKSVSGSYNSWFLPEAIDTNFCGSTFPIKFMVINNENLIWPCILGEDSVFQFARIDFWKFKGYFEIELRKDLN